MDNVTHTLIGISLGHVAARGETAKNRMTFVWTAGLASNFADFDFLMPYLFGDTGKLGYLLHHRGHSHTLALVPLMAFISLWIARKVTKNYPLNARKLYFWALLCAALHIGADSWNDYGVHPFWPVWNRWFHGDSVFIIEPTFLFAMIPFAIFVSQQRWLRYFWTCLFVILGALVWAGPFTNWAVAAGLTAWALGHFLLQRRRTTPLTALAGVAGSLSVFLVCSAVARSNITQYLKANAPDEELIQLATSPSPANPACWRAMMVSTNPSGEYFARTATYSLLPPMIAPRACNYRMALERTSELTPVSIPASESLFWWGEFKSTVPELKQVFSGSCQAQALSRFVRIAYWKREQGSAPIGDLRYDFQKDLSFAEIDLEQPEKCPWWVPPWTPPLAKLLD